VDCISVINHLPVSICVAHFLLESGNFSFDTYGSLAPWQIKTLVVMGSVGLEASLPGHHGKKLPFTLICPRAASTPVPQNNIHYHNIVRISPHELIDLMLMKFVLIFLVVRFIVTRFLASFCIVFG
jgi:hypothetical protein